MNKLTLYLIGWFYSTSACQHTASRLKDYDTAAGTFAATTAGRSGMITHLNYGNNENENWNVVSDCDSVYVSSVQFDVEPVYDYLTIDGTRYTGSQSIDQMIRSRSFTVSFSSDMDTTSSGFILNWSCYQPTSGKNGSIMHQDYINDEDEEWEVASDCDRVYIHSEQLELEADYDYLTIDDRRYTAEDQIHQLVSPMFSVLFHSDSDTTNVGFVLHWTCVNQTFALPSSSFTLVQNGSIIHTNYENDEHEQWNIDSECDRVYIYSEQFDLEAEYDYLIINGTSYSGRDEVRQIVSPVFSIIFESDVTNTAYGFVLHWKCVNETFELPLSDNHILSDALCRSGNIFSRTIPMARIVAGVEAVPHSWPWIVSLQAFDFGHFCGGSIINNEWVVTAAHCCIDMDPVNVTIVIGAHDITLGKDEIRVKVNSLITHPSYISGGYEGNHDLCLINTDPFTLNNGITSPICLPDQDAHIPPDDDNSINHCYVAGWGLDENMKYVENLRSARVKIFSSEYCANKTHFISAPAVSEDSFDPETEFCAGTMVGLNTGWTDDVGADTCSGDSGGPLVCVTDGQPVLYGVTSWGTGCGEYLSPGIYAKVAPNINWFRQVIINQLKKQTADSHNDVSYGGYLKNNNYNPVRQSSVRQLYPYSYAIIAIVSLLY